MQKFNWSFSRRNNIHIFNDKIVASSHSYPYFSIIFIFKILIKIIAIIKDCTMTAAFYSCKSCIICLKSKFVAIIMHQFHFPFSVCSSNVSLGNRSRIPSISSHKYIWYSFFISNITVILIISFY